MEQLKRIQRDFFARDTITVAQELLGKYLIRTENHHNLIGKIIEVEAYLGSDDKACHSYNFRKTPRTEVMYKKPGTLYVYLIYGMHHCLNVITEPKGIPCAVLIRKLYPIKGIELMKERRNVKIGKNFKNLVDGPGKLCMAMDITRKKFNSIDSCSEDSELFFALGEPIKSKEILNGKRIGIEYAEEDKDQLLRFWVEI
jgi:DNA-3-methyladenine glycosylase